MRAAGAAVAPPAPWPTSRTATATRGLLSGANAANQASVSVVSGSGGGWLGSGVAEGSGLTVVRSSAVPVLPATFTPGTEAAAPVPSVTTVRMKLLIVLATEALVAWVNLGAWPLRSVGVGRRPLLPIVAATIAICSGVASTLP